MPEMGRLKQATNEVNDGRIFHKFISKSVRLASYFSNPFPAVGEGRDS